MRPDLGYAGVMTSMLQMAFEAAQALPPNVQDELARELSKIIDRVKGGSAVAPPGVVSECDDALVRRLAEAVMTDYSETLKALAK